MRTIGLVFVVALLIAGATTALWHRNAGERDFEAAATRVVVLAQAREGACPLERAALESEDIGLVSICSAYGLTAYVAAKRYPDISPVIFGTYGEVPEFRKILDQHGSMILPVIEYFRGNGSRAMRLQSAISRAWEQIMRREPVDFAFPQLSPDEYGYIAVQAIHRSGNRFLSEFEYANGAKRLWTPRIANFAFDVFAGGISDVEAAIVRGEKPTWAQIGWAALDVGNIALVGTAATFATSLKTSAAAAKTAAAGKSALLGKATFVGKTIGFVGKAGKFALVAAPVATIYASVRHPDLLASGGAWLAKQAGWPEWAGAFLAVLIPTLATVALLATVWRLLGGRWIAYGLFWITRRMSRFAMRAIST